MKKFGKYIIFALIAILIVVLVVVLKNKSLTKTDLDNDFGTIEYRNETQWGGATIITLSSNHELEYSREESGEEVTKKTLTDTEYNEFKETLINSGITKLSKNIGKNSEENSKVYAHETISISFLNGEKFETSGYGIEEQEFRQVVDALVKTIN